MEGRQGLHLESGGGELEPENGGKLAPYFDFRFGG